MSSQKYAVFNTDGSLYLRLDSAVNEIPERAVPVSDEIFHRMIQEVDGVWRISEGIIKKFPLPQPTPEQVQIEENISARAYLAETDWYVIRFQENGQPIPEEILLARQAAREKVIE